MVISALLSGVFAYAQPSPLAESNKSVQLNQFCPVMTEEPVDREVTFVYKGKTVAFCCDKCLKRFRQDPEKYLPHLPQFAAMLHAGAGAGDGAVLTAAPEASKPASESGSTNGDDDDTEVEAPLSQDEGSTGSTEQVEQEPWLARVHPAVVHFPLAGLPIALLAFLAWRVTGRDTYSKADVVPLLFAAIASIAAVITGNLAEEASRFSPSMEEIVERHEFISQTVMIIALVLSAFRIWRWNRLTGAWLWAYGLVLLLSTGLVGFTGFLGGSLVFGPDHLRF